MHHQIVLSKSVCVYNISIPSSYQFPALENRKRSDSFITQIPAITRSLYCHTVYHCLESSLCQTAQHGSEKIKDNQGVTRGMGRQVAWLELEEGEESLSSVNLSLTSVNIWFSQ